MGSKTNNMKALRALSGADLKKRLDELRAELSKERAKKAMTGAPTKTGRIRELRRAIARILTMESMKTNKPSGVLQRNG